MFPLFQPSFQRISGTNDTSFESPNIGQLEFATVPNFLFILKIILGKQCPILENQPNSRISFLLMPHTIRPLELTMYAHGYSHN